MAWGVDVSMGVFPGVGMTGGASAWSRLADRNALQGASNGVMTADAVVVGIKGCAGQGVVVTRGTAGASHSHEHIVARGNNRWVDDIPGFAMTVGTVTDNSDVFTKRTADQDTIGIVATGAAEVRISASQASISQQGVIVTAGAARGANLNQQTVIRGIDAMDPFPAVAGRNG